MTTNKYQRLYDLEIFTTQLEKEKIEFSRKPLWIQQNEIGDRMADGSDDQPYEPEEEI